MSVIQKISSQFHAFVRYVNTKWLGQAQELTEPVIPEITRYFLTEAIEDRVKVLSLGDQTKEEFYRLQVLPEYNQRIEDALTIELKLQLQRFPTLSLIEKNLSSSKFPQKLTDELLAAPDELWRVLRTRGAFVTGRLGAYDAQILFGIFLRAVQQSALDIVRIYEPAKGTAADVPAETQQIIRKILRRVDDVARVVKSPIELKSAAKAETELRVSVARAKGAACLPLRPIPTSPLEHDDLEQHYVGRPDEDALRLARQIRHADGTILVTGYRGVGKSSFVNRVIFHALEAQKEIPKDGWIVVPVNVNLAKVAGVQNILRLTLRAVREALLESNSRKPQRIRVRNSSELSAVRLPLRLDQEIELLEEAYIRATYKVTMTRTNGSENRSELGSSIGLGAGKLVSGMVGVELGKFLEAGVKRTRIEKINRELNLLDYDENAAEQDLAKLIYSLANPRPLYLDNGGPDVKIKLVFVFDELDKMDIDLGLKPMIEGLKNLFLQQYSVFILVTSKRFYYDLLKDRAIEDAMLNSYFSAIVHVPLLSFAQARKMVENWVDWDATEQLKTKLPAELKLIEQLTRVLVYRSFGNPRDIIRELRLMQEWADTEQPFLTDRLAKSPALQIFAAIQDCVEKAALPQQSTSIPPREGDGAVALVSERLVGDEARLEQIRRGLYILTEELINRQTLTLDNRKQTSTNNESAEQNSTRQPEGGNWQIQLEEFLGKITRPAATSTESTPLAKIQQDNFSLLSVEDVRQLAKRLGDYLKIVHNSPDLFSTKEWGERRELFEMPSLDQLRVTTHFYALTGRQALAASGEEQSPPSHKLTEDELVSKAENLAGQNSWASKLAAINIIGQLPSSKITPTLEEFLWEIVGQDPEASHRLAAAEKLTPAGMFNEPTRTDLVSAETDERVQSILIRLLAGAPNEESRKLATDTIIKLLKNDTVAPARVLSESRSIDALTVLQTVADRDETQTVLDWLVVSASSEVVESTAVQVLTKFAEEFKVDVADKIISNEKVLPVFIKGSAPPWVYQGASPDSPLKAYLRQLLRTRSLDQGKELLDVNAKLNVEDLLAYIWEVSMDTKPDELSSFLFAELLSRTNTKDTLGTDRLFNSLRKTREFQTRLLPYLNRELSRAVEATKYKDEDVLILRTTLTDLQSQPDPPPPPKPRFNPVDIFKRTPPILNTYGEVSTERNWNQTIGFSALSAISFLIAALFFRRDLEAGASFGRLLLSRLILFCMEAAISIPFLINTSRDMEDRWLKQNTSTVLSLAGPIALFFFFLHTQYIGPLTIRNQLLQWLVHLPALFCAYAALALPVKRNYVTDYGSLIK